MKFIDEAEIEMEAGNGGPGSRSFRREKFVPLGGPDGGDGGRGGDIVFVADQNKLTLLDFRFQPRWKAEDGEPGGGSKREGKSGEDLVVFVPVGTQVIDAKTKKLVADLNTINERVIIRKGGRGGKGNDFFKSATNRAPERSQPGEPGETGRFILSLKLVADVGLVGFPNAGKSTLISRISAARPKIADYPFTTLTPNLGVVQAKGGRSFVVADIPGLIPGASEGKGLGIQFLKHVERTRVIAHLIDPLQLSESGEPLSPLDSFELINTELKLYSKEISLKPQVVVLTKSDAVTDEKILKDAEKAFKKRKIEIHIISSVSGAGIDTLIEELAKFLK